ncbi:hypothetical protein PPYR_10935 [Photinus pyralis]|uniref:E3 ubiquitin-protein ligase n=1 Tax=Photinus pyralis TaxID=7054 RepID=A0A1Y1KHU4_PHOPY|nr:hypothetical protein PPYR_10935 [Photinus pyralis]
MVSIKCKRCRNSILGNGECATLINAHGVKGSNEPQSCSSILEENLFYIDEEQLPDWIHSIVVDAHWSKGKLNCPHCKARIGSFDFVSGVKCACDEYILPPVHIINSKVDIIRL